jgi:adenosylcobinamide-GDP ribazoletransferase
VSEPRPAPVTDFLAAMQFLTLMPPAIRRDFTAAEMGRALGYYPLVGLTIGLVLAGADSLLNRFFPAFVGAALLLTVWVLLTGGLHIDGFLDACDGLLGGSTPEQRLEIMRDHRIGAFAFIGSALLFIVKFAALTGLGIWRLPALILAPLLGRWAMSLAVIAFPYARPQGFGREMKTYAGWPQTLLATLTTLAVLWLFGEWRGLAALLLTLLVMLGIARFTLKRIPGLTGDIYGMICEAVELAVLLLFSMRGIL